MTAVRDADTDEQPRWARASGAALLLICASALLSNDLIVPGEAVATAHNILAHERWFRVGILGELAMLSGDIVLAVTLYMLLKRVNQGLALLGSALRLMNAFLLALGVTMSLVAIDLIGDARYSNAFNGDQTAALMRELLNVHGTSMSIGLVTFGVGAGIHSYLLLISKYIPRLLAGAYLLIATIIFVLCTAMIVWPSAENILNPWLLAPDFFIEVAVALWLFFRGVNVSAQNHDAVSQ